MSEKCRQKKPIPKLNHGALQLKLSLKRRLGLLQFLLTNRKPKYDIFHFSVVERWGVWQLWVCEITDVEGPCNFLQFQQQVTSCFALPFFSGLFFLPSLFLGGGLAVTTREVEDLAGDEGWGGVDLEAHWALESPAVGMATSLTAEGKNREKINLTLLSKRDLGLYSV